MTVVQAAALLVKHHIGLLPVMIVTCTIASLLFVIALPSLHQINPGSVDQST